VGGAKRCHVAGIERNPSALSTDRLHFPDRVSRISHLLFVSVCRGVLFQWKTVWRPCKLYNPPRFCLFACFAPSAAPQALSLAHMRMSRQSGGRKHVLCDDSESSEISAERFAGPYAREYLIDGSCPRSVLCAHIRKLQIANCASKIRGDGSVFCAIPRPCPRPTAGRNVTYLRLLAHIVVRGQQGHQELLELSLIRCHLVLLVQMNQNTRVAGTTIFTSVFTRRRPPKKEQSNWLGCQRVPISRTARWVRGHREFSGAVRWSVTKQLFYGFRVVYPTFYAILEVQARWNIAEAPLTTLVAAIDNDRLLLARKRVSQPVMPETSRSNPNS